MPLPLGLPQLSTTLVASAQLGFQGRPHKFDRLIVRELELTDALNEPQSRTLPLAFPGVAVGGDEGTVATPGLDDLIALQLAITSRHGIGRDSEVVGEPTHGGELRPGDELTTSDGVDDLLPHLLERGNSRPGIDDQDHASCPRVAPLTATASGTSPWFGVRPQAARGMLLRIATVSRAAARMITGSSPSSFRTNTNKVRRHNGRVKENQEVGGIRRGLCGTGEWAMTYSAPTALSANSALTLPVLDLSRLDQGEEAAEAFRRDLREATRDFGFFYLTGHGVSPQLVDRVMSTSRAFFALPDEDKLAIENVKSPQFRGYTRVGGELTRGAIDWREQIDIGPERDVVPIAPGVADYFRLEGPNQWPAALPGLREVVNEWHDELSAVSLTLMRAWAVSLGAEENVFDEAFAQNASTLIKIVRYPGKSDPMPKQGVGAHKDSGVLTLLFVEPGKAGLQVEKDGDWIDAPPLDGAFVVNIGELLEVATNGYLKATVHRVISPSVGDDRISIPFFYSPALDGTIPILTLPPELQSPGITTDPDNPIFRTYGENVLKSRLRAHPDVAAIHHADLLAAPATD